MLMLMLMLVCVCVCVFDVCAVHDGLNEPERRHSSAMGIGQLLKGLAKTYAVTACGYNNIIKSIDKMLFNFIWKNQELLLPQTFNAVNITLANKKKIILFFTLQKAFEICFVTLDPTLPNISYDSLLFFMKI